jgi:hypothetical protein
MTADGSTSDPVTRVRPETRTSPDAPPPDPPRELERDTGFCRPFEHAGENWIARAAGKAAGGTGAYGLGMIEAVHFALAADPAQPLFEALIAAGSLSALYDEELGALLRGASRIVTLEEVRAAAESRGGRGLGDA